MASVYINLNPGTNSTPVEKPVTKGSNNPLIIKKVLKKVIKKVKKVKKIVKRKNVKKIIKTSF